MCFLFLWKTPMLLSFFPVLIYSTTEKGQPPILLKSEIDSTSYKIPKLVKTIIMLTLPQIFKRKKTVLLKELIKRFVCVCARKTVPSRIKANGLNLKMKGTSCSSLMSGMALGFSCHPQTILCYEKTLAEANKTKVRLLI